MNPLDLIAPGLDAAAGIVSAIQARNAFKNRYQDTVKDMRKAGLNPALAYGQGGGNPQTVALPNPGESYTRSRQTSSNVATQAASAKQSQANAELTEAQTNLLRAQTADLSRRPFLENLNLEAQHGLVGAQTTNTAAQTDYTRLRSLGQQYENVGTQMRNDVLAIDRTLRQLDADYASRTLEDRVALAHKATIQAGLNISATELANVLADLQIPGARFKADSYNTATDVKNHLRDSPVSNPMDEVSDAVENFIAKLRRKGVRAGLLDPKSNPVTAGVNFRGQFQEKLVVGLLCEEDTLTQQQFVEEADINTLVRRFGLDKVAMPVAPFNPAHYGDFSDVPDLRTALDLVNDAKNRFMALPPALRSRFHNSPGEMWDFVNDPDNGQECVRLGLLAPLQPETPAAVDAAVDSTMTP